MSVDVFVRTKNVQAWALGSTRNFVTDTVMTTFPTFIFIWFRNHNSHLNNFLSW
ncbi:hypothetical protein FD41_GL002092 [Lentilactobacillus farraginis DSM 18382 = JCM 14108]|uniref:Uncharacterized protein n=1 Tax=Lentilactobacillus farraginis DSM 18382 = JCM 14108 TaxID=1423743 RepID=X0QGD0_9LACO|nr:hypothetical protein FD41_GL002092 [Lentilactobacillus farraginis DSM 18382 = JCM 14108]GAF37665.1 hypothetical protein JCM14108_2721 [Lentilactobacillus farraginis DSM 18382 = JCM 14108]